MTQALDGRLIEVTTMGELLLERAKGGRGCLIEQPRPQGAFPWLWRSPPFLQSRGKAPWRRGCLTEVAA